MKLRVSGADPAGQELDALIIPLARSETLPRGLRGLDAALDGAITRSLERGDFAGNPNELSALLGGEQAAKRIILIGLVVLAIYLGGRGSSPNTTAPSASYWMHTVGGIVGIAVERQ